MIKEIITQLQSENGIVIEKVSTKDTSLNLPNDFFIKESYRIVKWKLVHHTNNLKVESLLTGVFDYDWKVSNDYLTNTKKDTINWIKENINLLKSGL